MLASTDPVAVTALASTPPPDDSPGDSLATDYRRLRRDLLAVESAELENLYQNGTITDATRRGIQRILDLEDAGLSDEEP